MNKLIKVIHIMLEIYLVIATIIAFVVMIQAHEWIMLFVLGPLFILVNILSILGLKE